MKKRIILPILLALLFISGNSYAETYVSLYAGLVIPHDADVTNNITGNSGQMTFRNNFNYGAKLGYWFSGMDLPDLGVQIDANKYNTDTKEIVSNAIVAPVTANVDVNSVVASVLLRGSGNVKPYIGAGAGWFQMEIGPGQKPISAAGIPGGWAGGTDSAFGWQVQAGLDFNLTEHTSFFTEYRFGNANFSFDRSTGVPLDINYMSSQFNGGLTYSF